MKKIETLAGKGIIAYYVMIIAVRTIVIKLHCAVPPTYYPEGLTNVLLEPSACGRPIITTYRSGCREVIKDGKGNYM